MAFTTPTVDDFLAAFPEFEGSEDAIEVALAAAARQVDSTWFDADGPRATMLLAAHIISAGEVAAAGGRSISSERIGPLAVSYFQDKGSEWYESTGYGQQFATLLRQNHPPVLVI